MANEMRLINAEDLKERIRQEPTDGMYTAEILEAIDEMPTVDAALVVHGRWVWVTGDVYRCTNCGSEPHVQEVMGMPDYDFCPFCGAKMDGGGEDGKTD